MSKKRIIIFICGLVVMAAGIGYIVYHFVSRAQKNAVYDEIRPTIEERQPEETKEIYKSPIDFEELAAINTDIYAWIEIPDTSISYPVVQGGLYENYYLDHTIEKQEGFPGAIYTQMVNSKTFEDFNTVIYGHELNDGTMFTPLHNYMDPEFFNTHREIKIYLPEKELTYKVFAAITYDDRLIPGHFDFNTEYGRKMFLDSVYGNRYMTDHFADDIAVKENDQIITLSTCLFNLPANRYLVIAVKTAELP